MTPDESLRGVVIAAATRFESDLASLADSGPRIRRWLGGDVRAFALRGLVEESFPTLALPAWVIGQEALASHLPFLIDLTYSSLHGFCFIRLIDDVADGDEDPRLRLLLPVCGFFHERFQSTYAHRYPPEHLFWRYFRQAWDQQAEASAADAHASTVTNAVWEVASSKKFSAGKVPVAAACFESGNLEDLAAWLVLVDQLGAFYQMINDVRGYRDDRRHNIKTRFLSELEELSNTRNHDDLAIEKAGLSLARDSIGVLGEAALSTADRLSSSASSWIHRRLRSIISQLETQGEEGEPIGRRIHRPVDTNVREEIKCLL